MSESGKCEVSLLCESVGMSRQNFYKQRSVRQKTWVDESLVLELIRSERCVHRRMGGRKLLYLLKGEMAAAGVSMGRDRLFSLLGRHDLLVEKKRNGARTTRSWHGFGTYPNLAAGMKLTAPHQLWVSDITYIRTDQGFMYLCLVSDAYSRMIIGYHGSDNLEMTGALAALSMAMKQLPEGGRPTHHSDRGSQYCCGPYIDKLNKRGMSISMTEKNHCYENAKAERLNGIVKQEYGLGETFGSKAEAAAAVRQAVHLYNDDRPHESLKYLTPSQVHGGRIPSPVRG